MLMLSLDVAVWCAVNLGSLGMGFTLEDQFRIWMRIGISFWWVPFGECTIHYYTWRIIPTAALISVVRCNLRAAVQVTIN